MVIFVFNYLKVLKNNGFIKMNTKNMLTVNNKVCKITFT